MNYLTDNRFNIDGHTVAFQNQYCVQIVFNGRKNITQSCNLQVYKPNNIRKEKPVTEYFEGNDLKLINYTFTQIVVARQVFC